MNRGRRESIAVAATAIAVLVAAVVVMGLIDRWASEGASLWYLAVGLAAIGCIGWVLRR